MKLTIDTTNDSKEEIRKAIRLLMSLVGDSPSYSNESSPSNIFDSPSSSVGGSEPQSGGLFGAMFDNPVDPPKDDEDKPDEKPSVEVY